MKPWWKGFFGHNYINWYRHQSVEHAHAEAKFVAGCLDPNGPLLDVCCGWGRHSVPLARMGIKAIGLDQSDFLLSEARRLAGDTPGVQWVRGDMRTLPFERQFSSVVNLFTSFGYFEDPDDDRLSLAEMVRVLLPGGRLILDVINRDFLESCPSHASWWEDNGTFFLEDSVIDWNTNVTTTSNILISPEGVQRYTYKVRLYNLAMLTDMLESLGMVVQNVWGGLDGSAFTPTSFHVTILAEKTSDVI
jgi:ubiquinone/menaquinone biosynthesis C-methylase UbiE